MQKESRFLTFVQILQMFQTTLELSGKRQGYFSNFSIKVVKVQHF